MRRIAAIFFCMMLLISMTGCDADNSDTTNTLNMTITTSPATMDPQLVTDTCSAKMVSLFMSSLLSYNSKNELQPALAESYDVSADNLTYTFHLRDGLKWSDGRDLTARDFVFGFRRLADPDTGSGAVYMITDSCTIKNANKVLSRECEPNELGVFAPDDRTFVVELENPCPYFPSLMTTYSFAPCNEEFFNKCAGEYATTADKILCCGAYTVDRYEPLAVQIHYMRNPDYFTETDRLPEEINIQVVNNEQQGVMCYETGMFDIVGITGSVMSWLDNKDELCTIDYANSQFIFFGNMDTSPVKNRHIRRALSLDVDREGLVKKVLQAGAYALNRINPKSYFRETDGTDFSIDDHRYDDDANYNPEIAKKEWEQGLKELGTDKIELELAFDSSAQNHCEVLKQEWEKTLPGLVIKLNMLQTKDWVLASTKAEHDLLYFGWAADYVDPTAFFNLFKTGSHGKGEYSNPDVDKLLEKAGSTEIVNNPDERNKILHQIEDLLMKDAAEIPLFSDQICFLVNSEYSGFDLTPTSSGYTIDSLERRG